jgi:hypothetical protein
MSKIYEYARASLSRKQLTKYGDWYFDWAVFGSEEVPTLTKKDFKKICRIIENLNSHINYQDDKIMDLEGTISLLENERNAPEVNEVRRRQGKGPRGGE